MIDSYDSERQDEEFRAALFERTVDDLWDALREVACSTRPSSDASGIVMLRKNHVRRAVKLLDDGMDCLTHDNGG